MQNEIHEDVNVTFSDALQVTVNYRVNTTTTDK